MKYEVLNIIAGATAFLLVVIIQSLTINGIKGTMEDGMIFEKYGNWIKGLGWMGKPLGLCTKCMAVTFGGLMYWPLVIIVFDFHIWQVPVFIVNAFCVSCLSWYFYKQL